MKTSFFATLSLILANAYAHVHSEEHIDNPKLG